MLKKNTSLVLIVFVAAVCAYVSAFHVQLLLIRGHSMHPTYRNLTFALLNKHETAPKRGDVIAFSAPGEKGALIKRVVGVPGDVLHASDDGLIVNGKLHPDYMDLEDYGVLLEGIALSDGEYFVLGDNTRQSRDSRYEEIGIVRSSQIYGTVMPRRSYEPEKQGL